MLPPSGNTAAAGETNVANNTSTNVAIARELWDTLLTSSAVPISYIQDEHLLIVPHGPLHHLAFAALHDGEQYVIEKHTVSYLPSASSLQFMQQDEDTVGRKLLILGNADGSLPHSAGEARVVAALYGVKPLLGDEATEQVVKEKAGEQDILHLAAHGVYQPLSPLFTRLELARSDQEDGLLEVHEIQTLDLTGLDIVILSACESQEGDVSNGDEVLALNRAFLYAGAPAVVASLWPVEDAATAQLMVAFHQKLRKDVEPAAALQSAQQAILADPATGHPYYWAAFGLTGGPGQEKPTRTLPNHVQNVCGLRVPWLLLLLSPVFLRRSGS